MKNSKKKGNKILIVLLVAVVAGGAVGYLSKGFKDLDYKNWFNSATSEEVTSLDSNSDTAVVGVVDNGITLNQTMSADTTTKSFTYTINPSIHTGSITYELTCSNTELNPSDYYSIVLDTDTQSVVITLVSICDFQCSLKLYSIDDPTINAIVSLDYQQRITDVSSNLVVVENTVFDVTNVVTKSRGSINVSTDVTAESLVFNDTFVSNVEALLNFDDLDPRYGDGHDFVTTGLTDAEYWLTNVFTGVDFLESITRSGIFTREDDQVNVDFERDLVDMNSVDVLALFDGVKPVFNYTAVVNGDDYTTQFGLNIDTVPITNIETSTSSIVF